MLNVVKKNPSKDKRPLSIFSNWKAVYSSILTAAVFDNNGRKTVPNLKANGCSAMLLFSYSQKLVQSFTYS